MGVVDFSKGHATATATGLKLDPVIADVNSVAVDTVTV